MGSSSELGNERASETWWNKQAALRGVHGRQASTYWSIALAAAVMGLVILGHRWQYERRQNQQLRLRLCAKEEVMSLFLLLCLIMRFSWSVCSTKDLISSSTTANQSWRVFISERNNFILGI